MNDRHIELDLTLSGSADLYMEDVPGVGILTLHLTVGEQDLLLDLLLDAQLARSGMHSEQIKWEDALAGDIIPCLGGKLIDVPHVLPASDNLRGYIQGVGILDLYRGLEVRVNRRIQ